MSNAQDPNYPSDKIQRWAELAYNKLFVNLTVSEEEKLELEKRCTEVVTQIWDEMKAEQEAQSPTTPAPAASRIAQPSRDLTDSQRQQAAAGVRVEKTTDGSLVVK